MEFQSQPPSSAWEAIPLPQSPQCAVWAWFKPAAAPTDVLLQIPAETHAACGALSLRQVVQIIGLPVDAVVTWSVQGATYPVQGGTNPLLDQPLPPPGPWGNPAISVRMAPERGIAGAVAAASPPQPPPMAPAAVAGSVPAGEVTDERALKTLDSDWHALLALETQLSSVRKQLGALQGQLQSLNRDLGPDERLVADNQDKKDWQDARRWLRDGMVQVSRWIRDHDIGMVSAAGNRNRFEEIYEQYVAAQRPFPGMASVCLEMEQHRKTAQHLLMQMQSAHQNASRDGVNRARQVLSRIAAKVRKSKEKRGTR